MEGDDVVGCHHRFIVDRPLPTRPEVSLATEPVERPLGGHLEAWGDVTFYRDGFAAACPWSGRLACPRHRVRGLGLHVSRDRDRRPDAPAASLRRAPLP